MTRIYICGFEVISSCAMFCDNKYVRPMDGEFMVDSIYFTLDASYVVMVHS